MTLNDPSAPQTAIDRPRFRVKVNGVIMPGCLSVSITSNNYYQCDQFRASFAFMMGPPGWWDIPPVLMIEIEMSTDSTAWPPAPLFIGEADHIQVHIQTGLVELEGRDLSARFIESKTQEAFPNQTASQVIATLAARHGNMATRITPTTALVGRYYTQNHSKVSLGQFSKVTTEWDLMVFLAQHEGFDVFMSGATLVFQPTVNPLASPYVLQWTPPTPVPRLNAISLTLERSLTLAKDVLVTVQSWHGREGRTFTRRARAVGGKATNAAGSTHGNPISTQQYVVIRPNLTEADAQALANQLAHEITLHERIVNVEMPGETMLTPRNMAQVAGTNTSFDQVYYIASITRSISWDEGFRQSMRIKNSSPRTQVLV